MIAIPKKLCGWKEDSQGIRTYAKRVGSLRQVASDLLGGPEKDVHMWTSILACKPRWRRGSQEIGDCVSWGAEICATSLMATDHVLGEGVWEEEAATEPIYGGSRVEALNKSRGGRSDGAFGYAAARWLCEYGVLLRKDYSKKTGNPEHNLKTYSGTRSKDWGDFGCGGKEDKGTLEKIAKSFPIENVVQITQVSEAIAALSNYYPISIASMAGFGEMVRNSDGVCKRIGEWAHQMSVLGLRFHLGKPQFRVFQSWGDSCSGADPEITQIVQSIPGWKLPPKVKAGWNPISACSWWITEADLAWILRTGDCWSYAGVRGFEPRKLDTKQAILSRLPE